MLGQRIVNNILGCKPKVDVRSRNKQNEKMSQEEWENLNNQIREESYNPNSPWFDVRLDEEKKIKNKNKFK